MSRLMLRFKLATVSFHSLRCSGQLLTDVAVTTGHVMSMDELANVKGRGWDDVDVSATGDSSRTRADPNLALKNLDDMNEVTCCRSKPPLVVQCELPRLTYDDSTYKELHCLNTTHHATSNYFTFDRAYIFTVSPLHDDCYDTSTTIFTCR